MSNSPAAKSLTKPSCVLLFSGGRDSTIAAIRLANSYQLTLVTVCSGHLSGIEQVEKRLSELSRHLPADTEWLLIDQKTEITESSGLQPYTCLPCQLAYVVTGIKVAKLLGSKTVALGYTAYQSTWPEQTDTAVTALRSTLAGIGIDLILPVQDLQAKEEVIQELNRIGLDSASLEQKCARQKFHVELDAAALQREVGLWVTGIEAWATKDLPIHALARRFVTTVQPEAQNECGFRNS